ncbi:hypothetical protein [Sphingomonas bacterium]|uniref:hypothetical protein n=1 Tax=Sphingomonas bacterium TaxID=1895847 RepID=UPI001576CBD1|nr:hypothetical protein [Sphingomonas bacterium]
MFRTSNHAGYWLITGIMLASSATAQSSSSGNLTSDGSSTGVGNAGSFGIGSGTSDSLSTATAISNGVQDSSTKTSIDNSTSIVTISNQDLSAVNAGNQITINAGADPASSPLPTGSNVVTGSSLTNFAGILTAGWNTGPAATAQAGTNIAVNGNFGNN